MIEKTSTMQSEQTDDCPAETPLSVDRMTFSKSGAMLTPEQAASPLKFDVNLDDDIEKVELDSHESSSSDNQKTDFLPLPDFPEENPNDTIKNWLKKITEINNVTSTTTNKKAAVAAAAQPAVSPAPSRVIKYQDLPYMGEITLDNSKPRRGRKPKKADICHLIYKNYGTIFPGTPNANSYLEKPNPAASKKGATQTDKTDQEASNKSDVQSKIISSLLEKRLTQECRKSLTTKTNDDQNEPLNLCIRDLNHLKIRFLADPEVKSEPQSDEDVELINGTPSPSPVMKNEPRFTPDSVSASSTDTPNTPESSSGAGNYMYWPNSGGLFIHPMALQQQLMMYQRLAGNMNYALPSHSPRPPPAGGSDPKPDTLESLRKIVPKPHPGEAIGHRHSESRVKRNAAASCTEKMPAKRKRSAIFIPPIPTENTTNPATEVSICKFKFTGGAKPSLQEKKMLSVDSGGNFRYYSGTGDKSMRGYEFFPRETLQQQISNAQGSSTGAFLQASGEKIYPAPPLDITGGSSTSDFLLAPDLPGGSSGGLAALQQEGVASGVGGSGAAARSKKRKSRKSIQREKLEQTFKEKGFLIQTQQLESAEGATYCKFRQLRKFTRYLFRSWKDYLPGNVRELNESEQRELQASESMELHGESADDIASVQSAEGTANS